MSGPCTDGKSILYFKIHHLASIGKLEAVGFDLSADTCIFKKPTKKSKRAIEQGMLNEGLSKFRADARSERVALSKSLSSECARWVGMAKHG
jgi:hypothetical protein